MAVLAEEDRAEIWAQIMRDFRALGIETELVKAEVRDLIDAADTWLEANAAAYNLAIPVLIRARTPVALKAWALSRVAGFRAKRAS